MKFGMLLFFAFFTVNTLTAQTAETATVVIKSSIVCSHCLECGTCGELLDEAVLDLSGVKNMEINTTDNTITVYYKPEKISVEEIKKAIVAVGYDADEMKAEKAAYEQLDGCCKAPDQH
jgi:mercuric ion binding protein